MTVEYCESHMILLWNWMLLCTRKFWLVLKSSVDLLLQCEVEEVNIMNRWGTRKTNRITLAYLDHCYADWEWMVVLFKYVEYLMSTFGTVFSTWNLSHTSWCRFKWAFEINVFVWGDGWPNSMIEGESKIFYRFPIHVVVRRNENHEVLMKSSYLGWISSHLVEILLTFSWFCERGYLGDLKNK